MLGSPRGGSAFGALLVGATAVFAIGPGCQLFHSTDWPTACDLDAGTPGCPGGASGSGAGHATSSSTGGVGGSSGGGGGSGGGVPHDGSNADRAALSCDEIVKGGYGKGSRVYWLDVDGDSGLAPFTAYCEIVDGVGWTLAGVVSAEDGVDSWLPAAWSDVSTFGVSSSAVFTSDMKNTAWLGLASKDLRLENETGGLKTATLAAAATLQATFGNPTLVELAGMQSGWTYIAANNVNFFAEIQNPPASAGKNLAQRNACVLTMGYDSYLNASMAEDDEVQGFGCVGGSGGGSGSCFMGSCGDVVRDASLKIYVR